MSCCCVTSYLCEAPANLYPPRTPRTKCYACGLPVCKACSHFRAWRGQHRKRICDNCDQEDIAHAADQEAAAERARRLARTVGSPGPDMTRAPGMRDTEARREYPEGRDLEVVLSELPHGTAVSVATFAPYWDVCARRKKGTRSVTEYFVAETPADGGKPIRVSEPTRTKGEAVEDARMRALQFVDLHGGAGPEWPWETQ